MSPVLMNMLQRFAARGLPAVVALLGLTAWWLLPAAVTAGAPGSSLVISQGPPGLIAGAAVHRWSDNQKSLLSSLWLENLPPLQPDPSNSVADNPAAARLGHRFFFDTRFSGNGMVSCASCHIPQLKFTDGQSRAVGGMGVTDRKTMTIVGTAYSPWLFWDGRKDSQWSQALGPPENPVEHGSTRGEIARIIAGDADYRRRYEALFGTLPDLSDRRRFPVPAGPVPDPQARSNWEQMTAADRETVNRIYANMGKAIAAYERLIMPGPSRFDTYVEAVLNDDPAAMRDTFTDAEANGLRLFIGRAQCIQCHNGPLLTNHSFHNTGVPPAPELLPDLGRSKGVLEALEDPFNCLGEYSDAAPQECAHVRFAKTEGQELVAAFKVPTLRNVADTAPYMHAGQIPTLAAAIQHYNHAPPAVNGTSELAVLHLRPWERHELEAFLRTLSSPLATPAGFLAPPETAPRRP